MVDDPEFSALSVKERVLVMVAVLLDGREAAAYLESDATRGKELSAAALVLASIEPDLRMPYIGSVLRQELGNLE